MFQKYKLVIFGALAIAYGCAQLLALTYFSNTVLDQIRALEPQPASVVRGLPHGTPVLVEGRISSATAQRYGTLVAYVRSSELKYSDKQGAVWVEDDWVTPPLLLDVGGATIPIEAGYMIERSTIQKNRKKVNYKGFDRGSQVFAVGVISPAGAVRATTVYGGKRDDYLFTKTGEKWVGYFSSLFLIALGTVFIVVKLVFGRR
ncbi:hypothetical protein [Hymenobacter sp. YC55]|uniref:hypothetical protein n=1 Tax=Hymenobacter sp. YC55 TaxID=3034019 RepID=UPI0023F8D806|nr:hypothetical protein [Hymenobacter sp. YC55]MDF7810262.1 hypothetical protein [Hymenobacter sp. YC55]